MIFSFASPSFRGYCFLLTVRRRICKPDQTIAKFQRNISQHCWAQHIARVWPGCWDVLGVTNWTLLDEPGQTTTTLCNNHKCCMENLIISKLDRAAHNMSHATRKRSQHFNTTWLGAIMARLAALLQGRRFTVALSHLTSTRRKKIMLVFSVLMLVMGAALTYPLWWDYLASCSSCV